MDIVIIEKCKKCTTGHFVICDRCDKFICINCNCVQIRYSTLFNPYKLGEYLCPACYRWKFDGE